MATTTLEVQVREVGRSARGLTFEAAGRRVEVSRGELVDRMLERRPDLGREFVERMVDQYLTEGRS